MRSSSEDYNNKPSYFRTRKYLARGVGGLAAAGALFSAIHFGPKALEGLASDPSEIVAGVPGLVMADDSRDVLIGKLFVWKYWLYIEQCPQDVYAAEHGDPNSQSFNPNPSVLTAGCYADWVQVGGDTYSHYADGSTIVFDGKPTDHLRK